MEQGRTGLQLNGVFKWGYRSPIWSKAEYRMALTTLNKMKYQNYLLWKYCQKMNACSLCVMQDEFQLLWHLIGFRSLGFTRLFGLSELADDLRIRFLLSSGSQTFCFVNRCFGQTKVQNHTIINIDSQTSAPHKNILWWCRNNKASL
jgi:hypothetical protein